MSDVLKRNSRTQDYSRTRVRKRRNSSSSSDSRLSSKGRNPCNRDQRKKVSLSNSSSNSSSPSQNINSRRPINNKASSNIMSPKFLHTSRDRRNGDQPHSARDTCIREQRSYSQKESRYRVERLDRTFSNRMYFENQVGLRGINYRQRGNVNRNYRNFDDRRLRNGRELNRNYNLNRLQGRINQTGTYENRRRGIHQRNDDSFSRDRYPQRQRVSRERSNQDYGNSHKAEEARDYETPREQHQQQTSETREKSKASILEELRPLEDSRKKRRERSSSSSSSSSSNSNSSSESDDSSSSYSSSSSEDEKKRKKRKKIAKKLKKAEKKRRKKKLKKKLKKLKLRKEKPMEERKKNIKQSEDVSEKLVAKAKSMVPMTKEQWERKQNVVRKVYDEKSGRVRLVKGDGEIIEEIVSRERHKEINRRATRGDGGYFMSQTRDNQ